MSYAEFFRRGGVWTLSGDTLTSRLPPFHVGNLLLMVTVYNGAGAFSVPAGWTAVNGSPWSYGSASIPPQIWTEQHIMACWKIASTNSASASNGPTFTLDHYDADNFVSFGGRVYMFHLVDEITLAEAPFTGTPILASSLVSYPSSIVRPPQTTDPGRPEQTVTYPSLDAGIVGDHSWLAFAFIHGSYPLAFKDFPNDANPDNMTRIDPALTGADAGVPPGSTQGPNDTFDHVDAEGAYFFASHGGDDAPNLQQMFQPDPTYWSLTTRDYDLFGDPYNLLPPVAGITMVVLGAPQTVAYWGINATTPA